MLVVSSKLYGANALFPAHVINVTTFFEEEHHRIQPTMLRSTFKSSSATKWCSGAIHIGTLSSC